MSHRLSKIIREVFPARIRNRPLHKRSRNRIRPVQHDHLNTHLRRCFQKISQRSLVGVEARPGVLNIHHYGVKILQHIQRRTPRRIRPAIHVINRNSSRLIFGIAQVGGVEHARCAVLRTEEHVQRNSRSLGQHVNGATPLRIYPSLVGQQANSFLRYRPRSGSAFENVEIVLFEHINSRLYIAIPHRVPPRRALRLVIAGDALPAQRFFFAHRQRQRRRHRRRHLRAQSHRVSLASRMHRIGQQNNVSLGGRIDPHRRPRKTRVSKRTHRQQVSAVRGKRRIDIPSESTQNLRRRRLFRPGHLLDRKCRQNSASSIQQHLRKLRQVIRGREKARVPSHSAHPSRRRIVHHSPQHHVIVVILCRRDVRFPGG